MGPLRGAYICTQPCKDGGADMESWSDMCTCTDAYTHSNQGMGLENGATHGCTYMCAIMQRGWR